MNWRKYSKKDATPLMFNHVLCELVVSDGDKRLLTFRDSFPLLPGTLLSSLASI